MRRKLIRNFSITYSNISQYKVFLRRGWGKAFSYKTLKTGPTPLSSYTQRAFESEEYLKKGYVMMLD